MKNDCGYLLPLRRHCGMTLAGFWAIMICLPLASQETLLSERARYFDFLALEGRVERPTLNYRTLSDDAWDVSAISEDEYLIALGDGLRGTDTVKYRFYGPVLFSSYNSAFPHGSNDGSLWQGVGLNSSIDAGIRIELYGVEATLKPRLSWAQNKDFDTMPSAYADQPYGDYGIASIDLYQRPGDGAVWFFDWGDSEIRYTYGPATIGFGTQAIWLGPARLNPIISSNNAAPYPKLDIGLRRTPTPVGDIEARVWAGRLSESQWFDSDNSNDHVLLTGLSVSWAPSFADGLVFGFHRTLLDRLSSAGINDVLTLFSPGNFFGNSNNDNDVDQRGSVTIDYSLPELGFEVYLEWARNDFSSSLELFIVDPFHSQAYTLGARKTLNLWGGIRGEMNVEITSTEESRDFSLEPWDSTFYAHSIIVQGYTNQGQCLGAGIGTGGNSQYIGFTAYYGSGRSTIYIQRHDRNNDYLWAKYRGYTGSDFHLEFSTELIFGIESVLSLGPRVLAMVGVAYDMVYNPYYESWTDSSEIPRLDNFYLSSGISIKL